MDNLSESNPDEGYRSLRNSYPPADELPASALSTNGHRPRFNSDKSVRQGSVRYCPELGKPVGQELQAGDSRMNRCLSEENDDNYLSPADQKYLELCQDGSDRGELFSTRLFSFIFLYNFRLLLHVMPMYN